MYLDIALAVIFVIAIIAGWRSGFIVAFVKTVGWLIAIICGVAFTPAVADWLRLHTGLEQVLYTHLSDKLSGILPQAAGDATGLVSMIPDTLRNLFSAGISSVQTKTISNFVDIIFMVLAFIVILIAVNLVFWILTLLFSKRHRDRGLISASDSILGAVFGALIGAFVVCLLLALMLPIFNAGQLPKLQEQLESSRFAIRLYNNNPIFMLTKIRL